MAKKSSDYFGLGRLVSIILAIIPFTAWILGVVIRFQEGKIVAGIIRIFGGWLIWLLDLIFMIKDTRICRLLNI
ncbi:MAG: hypothetical protein IJA23_03875 [Clostridia bacterium]|nr:hypothetical protein [Clostridia bacterium]